MNKLSPREIDVLIGLSEGLAYKEIADKLGIRHDTVKFHLRNVRNKIAPGKKSIAVVAAGFRLGILV